MLTALSNGEDRKNTVFTRLLFFLFIILLNLGIDGTPTFTKNGTTSSLLAVGIEYRTEPTEYQVIDLALIVIDTIKVASLSSRDDGMVISHLRVVKHPLALWKLPSGNASGSIRDRR